MGKNSNNKNKSRINKMKTQAEPVELTNENKTFEPRVEIKGYEFNDASKVFLYDVFIKLIVTFFVIYFISSIAELREVSYFEFVRSNLLIGIMLTLVSPIILCLIFFGYSKMNKINIKSEIKPKSKVNIVMILICLLISVVCLFMMGGVFNCFDYLFYKSGYVVSGELAFEINNIWKLLLSILTMAILPAIFEELVYRGIILKGMLSKFKPWVAIIISALFFTLMHGSLDQTLFQFMLGVILCFVFYKTQNIIYPILIHFFNNTLVLVLNYLNSTILIGNPENTTYVIVSILLFIGGLGLILGAGYLINRYYAIKPIEESKSLKNNEKLGFLGLLNNTTKSEKVLFWGSLIMAGAVWLINTATGFVS